MRGLEWRCPQDTILLCQHVAEHGPSRWQELEGKIGWPAALCALKWHGVWLERSGGLQFITKSPYSDWELCVLFVAFQPAEGAQVSKKGTFTELAKWLPGRSAAGLRQAHAHHVQGCEVSLLGKLRANKWPGDLGALLAAWPGPSPKTQAALDAAPADSQRAIAARVAEELSAWVPLKRHWSTDTQALPPAAAAAAGNAAQLAGIPAPAGWADMPQAVQHAWGGPQLLHVQGEAGAVAEAPEGCPGLECTGRSSSTGLAPGGAGCVAAAGPGCAGQVAGPAQAEDDDEGLMQLLEGFIGDPLVVPPAGGFSLQGLSHAGPDDQQRLDQQQQQQQQQQQLVQNGSALCGTPTPAACVSGACRAGGQQGVDGAHVGLLGAVAHQAPWQVAPLGGSFAAVSQQQQPGGALLQPQQQPAERPLLLSGGAAAVPTLLPAQLQQGVGSLHTMGSTGSLPAAEQQQQQQQQPVLLAQQQPGRAPPLFMGSAVSLPAGPPPPQQQQQQQQALAHDSSSSSVLLGLRQTLGVLIGQHQLLAQQLLAAQQEVESALAVCGGQQAV